MSNEMKTDYRGYPIEYNEARAVFQAFVDGHADIECGNLRDLKAQIDEFEKQQSKKDFKRIKVYISNWRFKKFDESDGYIEGEVTSIADATAYWVSTNRGRSKETQILPINSENTKKITRIHEIVKEIQEKQDEKRNLEQSLERLTKGAMPT